MLAEIFKKRGGWMVSGMHITGSFISVMPLAQSLFPGKGSAAKRLRVLFVKSIPGIFKCWLTMVLSLETFKLGLICWLRKWALQFLWELDSLCSSKCRKSGFQFTGLGFYQVSSSVPCGLLLSNAVNVIRRLWKCQVSLSRYLGILMEPCGFTRSSKVKPKNITTFLKLGFYHMHIYKDERHTIVESIRRIHAQGAV